MTLTPETVRAAQATYEHQSKSFACYEMTDLHHMAPDLATAYLAQAEEIERLRNALFQAGQRFHAVCRSSASKTHIDAACDKWAWECHKSAGTHPEVPHILLEEVMPQAREALAAYRATEERG